MILPSAAGARVAVHPPPGPVEQDRPRHSPTDRSFDSPGHGRRKRNQHNATALADHPQDPVAMLLAQVGDVRPDRLEDP
jgi:hypothetical protein